MRNIGKATALCLSILPTAWCSGAMADKVNMDVYGNINRALMVGKDGHEGFNSHVDNDIWPSYMGIKARQMMGSCTVMGIFEGSVHPNSTGYTLSQLSNPASDASRFDARHMDVSVSGHWGSFHLGHGSTASDNTHELSKAGTYAATYSSIMFAGSSFLFHQKGAATRVTTADPTISNAFPEYDGLGRAGRVMYKTPDFNGFSAGASMANSDKGDIAAYYNYDGHMFDLSAALAYAKNKKIDRMWDGSIAVIHKDTGINAAFSYGKKKLKDNDAADASASYTGATKDPKSYYIQLGKRSSFFNMGMTSFVLEMWRGRHAGLTTNWAGNADSKSKQYGFHVVQEMTSNLEGYIGARKFKFETTAQKYDDIKMMMLGLRFHF